MFVILGTFARNWEKKILLFFVLICLSPIINAFFVDSSCPKPLFSEIFYKTEKNFLLFFITDYN